MLLPHHHVVVVQLADRSLGQHHRAGQLVGDDTQTARTESLGLGDHTPQRARSHILLEEGLVVREGNQLDGVRMQRRTAGRTLLQQVVMHAQVGGSLRGGHNGVVGNDLVVLAVVEDADDRAVVHRPTRQIAHTLLRTLAVEVATLQHRQMHTDGDRLADCGQGTDLVINVFGDIERDVTAITLRPTLLPQVAGHLGGLPYGVLECRAILKY